MAVVAVAVEVIVVAVTAILMAQTLKALMKSM